MFDIGWCELFLIGVVALIVVGPRSLPGLFRTVGKFIGKARAMAREFQRSMEQAANESGHERGVEEPATRSTGQPQFRDQLGAQVRQTGHDARLPDAAGCEDRRCRARKSRRAAQDSAADRRLRRLRRRPASADGAEAAARRS